MDLHGLYGLSCTNLWNWWCLMDLHGVSLTYRTFILAVSVNLVFSPFMAYLYYSILQKWWQKPVDGTLSTPILKDKPTSGTIPSPNHHTKPGFLGGRLWYLDILQGRDPCINSWIVDNFISWGSAFFWHNIFCLISDVSVSVVAGSWNSHVFEASICHSPKWQKPNPGTAFKLPALAASHKVPPRPANARDWLWGNQTKKNLGERHFIAGKWGVHSHQKIWYNRYWYILNSYGYIILHLYNSIHILHVSL